MRPCSPPFSPPKGCWRIFGFGGKRVRLWAYRLPSLIGAVLSVLLTFWIGSTLFGPTAGFLGAVMLAGTVLLGVEARTAKTDAALFATILAAQGVLANLWLRREAREALGLQAAIADRRRIVRAADILDRQHAVRADSGLPWRRHARRHRSAGGGGAHRQDRCGPVRHHSRRPRGAGESLASAGSA